MGNESKRPAKHVDVNIGLALTPIAGRPRPDLLWEDFLRRIAGGDAESMDAFYDQSNQLVFSVAVRILGNTSDAEEVTLDVYLHVWLSAKNFNSERGSALGWLMMLTRSRSIDRWRSGAKHRTAEKSGDELPEAVAWEASPEALVGLVEQRGRIRSAMASLPAEQREAIELAFYSGLTHTEMAETLGQPLGTIKTRVRLGLIKLREALGGR
ncbi:MAG: sigma-70 family RNA polymerase sigma factor [Bryobacteraceae bacterium]